MVQYSIKLQGTYALVRCNFSSFQKNRYFKRLRFRLSENGAYFIFLFFILCMGVAVLLMLYSFTPPPFSSTYLVDEMTISLSNEPAPCSSFPCFEMNPTSKLRPSNQFITGDLNLLQSSILTIITVTRGPNVTAFAETTKFIKSQSLKPIRWLLICDHILDELKYRFVENTVRSDHRFFLKNNSGSPGVSNSRNTGLELFKEYPTKYLTFIDDDDQMELNAYEKLIWVLESNRQADMSISYSIFYGEGTMAWSHGFHDGRKNLRKFYLTITVLMRLSAIEKSNCIFNEGYNTGMEDWDFFLCLAAQDSWGVTVPEYLFWYNRKRHSFRKARWPVLSSTEGNIRKLEIMSRYRSMEGNFPDVRLERTLTNESISMKPQFHNVLGSRKGVLLIISNEEQVTFDFYLRLVKRYTQRGRSVTVIFTHWYTWSGHQPHTTLQRYTHDLFVIPTFLRYADVPRFMRYIIDSRLIKHILISHSTVAYHLLPIVKHYYKTIPITDIVLQYHTFSVDHRFLLMSHKYKDYIHGTITNFGLMRTDTAFRAHDSREWFERYYGLQSSNPEYVGIRNMGQALYTRSKRMNPESTFRLSLFGDKSKTQEISFLLDSICNFTKSSRFTKSPFQRAEVALLGPIDLELSFSQVSSCKGKVGITIPESTDDKKLQEIVVNSGAIFLLAERNIPSALQFSLLKNVVPVAFEGTETANVLSKHPSAGLLLPRMDNKKSCISAIFETLKTLSCNTCREELIYRGARKINQLISFEDQIDDIVSWNLNLTERNNKKYAKNFTSIPIRIALDNMIKYSRGVQEFPGFYNKLKSEVLLDS